MNEELSDKANNTINWLMRLFIVGLLCFVWGFETAPNYIDDYNCTIIEDYYLLNGTLDFSSEHNCYYEHLSWNPNRTEYHNVIERMRFMKNE